MYAKWEINSYKLTINDGINTNEYTLKYNDEKEIVIPERKGYIFVLSTTLILCFIVMIFTAVSQSSVMTNTTESKKNSVIVIDCGHGGEDPGAVGVNNVYESDVNLSFGSKKMDWESNEN